MNRVLPHTELAFEQLIVSELTSTGGWDTGDPAAYDREVGLYSDDVVTFITTTQPKKWERLSKLSGGEAAARAAVLKRLASQLDKHSAVKVLRDGISERGVSLSLCQLRPAHSIDPETAARYEANQLRVVRQVRYETKSGDALDLALFVNGVPTATAELKNRWTGQTVEHAMKQYRTDRDPKNILFARRAFVHFAIDAELAYMTTRLAGAQTVFLPFNQGTGGPGQPGGAGNPGVADGHSTSYVWRDVWQRERWLELIQKFVHVEAPDASKGKGARSTIVFPRYHQWHVVVDCQGHARTNGAGHNYLIQHSAGSGKTKEIAWLAHDLSTLHRDNFKIFDKVIVITDRRVLDRQMRQQIAQFEQVAGVVRSVTDSSKELLEALRSEQAKVITTTLQKFPFVLRALDEEDDLSARTYAVIVDEAHSSQSGESAADLKQLLGSLSPDDLDLDEDDGTPPALLARLAARGRQPNLSFFAFTATPKGKTLELFGSKDDTDGLAKAFHTYSMRQAIEEGFIVDVLANYTTYDQLFRLETQAEETVEMPSGEASRRLARFTELHPYVKSQKAAVVVDHFKRVVRPLLGGEAKAMVVCESREEAVQWKRALDREIERHGHDNVKALVAFSGEVTVKHPEADNAGMKYTEPTMNKIAGKPLPESKLPDEFDKPAYGVLVVAEKYQTGFDQPKLCGMYVDKKLVGVNAVQTLSRLNRSYPGKDNVYVLDFRNTTEEIRKAFAPYYERTEGEPSAPNVLFDAADVVREFAIITEQELATFVDAWAKLDEVDEDKRHAVLSTSTQSAYLATQQLDADTRQEFREALNRFVRFYGFLSQALPWIPAETEVLFQFSKVLLARLSSEIADGGVDLSGTVTLTHYRLTALDADAIELGEEAKALKAITGDGTGGGAAPISMGQLALLVELFNERYGAELGPDDALAVVTAMRDRVQSSNPELSDQVKANSRGDFITERDELMIDAALNVGSDRERQAKLLKALLDDDDFRGRAGALIFGSIYDAYAGGQANA